MKRSNKLFRLLWPALLCLPGQMPALESIATKSLAVHLDQDSGRFYLEDPNPEAQGIRFFTFRDNPPTSYITLILNGNPYRLNAGVIRDMEYFKRSGQIISGSYTIQDVRFDIQFILTNSGPDNPFDSILLLIQAANQTSAPVRVGGRILLDTSYDEAGGSPEIYLSSTEQVTRERLIPQNVLPDFIFTGKFSSGEGRFGSGLYIFPAVNSLLPQSVIIGNWKKLDETDLEYKVRPNDQFRSSSYGSKDGAVSLLFNDLPVKPGETVTFGILLSRSQKPAPAMQEITAVQKTDTLSQTTTDQQKTVVYNQQDSSLTNNSSQATSQNKTTTVTVVKVVTNTVYVPVSGTNQTGVPADYQVLLQSQVQLLEKMNTILTALSGISNQPALAPRVITNVIQPPEGSVTAEELDVIQKGYENRIKDLEQNYQTLMEQQRIEMEASLRVYEEQLKQTTSKKNRVEAVNRLDTAIREMDQKIKVIEELEKLRLDYKTMPQEKLDELYNMLAEMERKITSLRFK